MSTSACPFCQKLFPVSELEWHANNHLLMEEEFQRDLNLACQISLAPTSPSRTAGGITNDANYFGETSGSRVINNTSVGEGNIHEKILCLSREQIRSTFYKVEGGLMVLLKRCLETENGNSVSIVTDYIDHYQSLQYEDKGWGCGWRNIQMLSSHLLMQRPEAREVLFGGSGFVPDIPSMQRWLELAWERGFDVSGSYDFNKEVYGSKRWIGTTECAALFRSFGLRARVVDFDIKESNSSAFLDGKDPGEKSVGRGKKQVAQVFGPMDKYLVNRHSQQADTVSDYEKSEHTDIQIRGASGASSHENNGKLTGHGFINKSTSKGHQILMEWVWDYFSDKCFQNAGNSRRVNVSAKTPLYFQHDGHSRTIIGIQLREQRGMPKQYTLLCLDPGHRTKDLEKSLRENVGWQKLIKRGVHTLKKPQYQFCYIDPGIADGKEMEQLKTIDSMLFES